MTMARSRKLAHHIRRDMLKQRNSKISQAINRSKEMATSLLGQISKLVRVQQELLMISNILAQESMNICQPLQILSMMKKITY